MIAERLRIGAPEWQMEHLVNFYNNIKMKKDKNLLLDQCDVSGSLPLNEQSLIRWGFKMVGDGSFDRELEGVRITLEYQVRFNNKIICDAPKTEKQFEALFYGLTGLVLSGNDH